MFNCITHLLPLWGEKGSRIIKSESKRIANQIYVFLFGTSWIHLDGDHSKKLSYLNYFKGKAKRRKQGHSRRVRKSKGKVGMEKEVKLLEEELTG